MILTPMTTSPCYCWGKERAVELRYFCCINFHLFYKQKRVTNLEVISYGLTTEFSLLVCKHQVNSSFFLTINIFFCCTVSMLWYLQIQQSCSLYMYSGRNPQLQKFQTAGIEGRSPHALWQPLKVLQLQEVKLLGSLHHSELIHSN